MLGSIPAWAGEPPSQVLTGLGTAIGVYPRVGGGTAHHYSGLPVSDPTVYPRVGGGTWAHSKSGKGITKRVYPRVGGGTIARATMSSRTRVYPRVGGGTYRPEFRRYGHRVYPRVGGGTKVGWDCVRRSIPAWAGEPLHAKAPYPARSIPAWAGEPVSTTEETTPVAYGLSPRGRGNPARCHPKPTVVMGLSPRGRGNHRWARQDRGLCRVYPRVGGGTERGSSFDHVGRGLSPRGRGNPNRMVPSADPIGSIPAWAGEPPLGKYWPTYIITSFASGT